MGFSLFSGKKPHGRASEGKTMPGRHGRNRIAWMGFLMVCLILLSACGSKPVPKNIILFIGDGMGLAQVTAARTVKGSLNLETFKVGGFSITQCADGYITDSAAGGTALLTGSKTNAGSVSLSPFGDTLKTVAEHAEERGKATGLVVTSSLTDATPASFLTHVRSRDLQGDIAEQMARSGAEVLFGGGLGYFLPRSDPRSGRQDQKELLAELRKKGPVALNPEDFHALGRPRAAAALLALWDIPPANERPVSLSEMTAKALEILSADREGFFLLVEGSQIDWNGHDNDSDGLILEAMDFDDAVEAGLSFLSRNPNTLVVVTADHESGGYTLLDGSVSEKKITQTHFSTDSHTGTMVPIFAAGPESGRFGGIHDNTFIGKTLIELVRKH
jgi:alkaline phosphatase